MKEIIQKIVDLIKTRLASINQRLTDMESLLLRILKFLFGFLMPLKQLIKPTWNVIKKGVRLFLTVVGMLVPVFVLTLLAGKIYQNIDRDPDRGAIEISTKSMGESYITPVYTKQGWNPQESLWFYNTTQGSNLLPYDFFVELEQIGSKEKFINPDNIDALRYLPQKATFFNPDSLPVGFVKDTYLNKDYVGLTCAACHTGQLNYTDKAAQASGGPAKAIRIDGGPSGADMDGFLKAMVAALEATLDDPEKNNRFVSNVLARNNFFRDFYSGRGYSSAQEVEEDLAEWTNRTKIYNMLNHSEVAYGYSRLDAFGRIYNRVLEHVLQKEQIANKAAFVRYQNGRRVLTNEQINLVLDFLNDDDLVIGQRGFEKIITRLMSTEPGFPGLNTQGVELFRDAIFNRANAPVSYPFLWDIAQSDYVQWNGLAANAGVGPLGRNTGEVIGVFGTLDWKKEDRSWWDKFSLAAKISGQSVKSESIDFKSSIDKVNLARLESQLKSLKSPVWKEVQFKDGTGLPKIDDVKAARGRQLYSQYCQSCHEIIVRDDWGRRVTATMMSVDKVGTDPKMATNGATYKGGSGNFYNIYQDTDVGAVMVQEQAPVVQILTAATRGVIATPDSDKGVIRRVADWVYALAATIADNPIEASVKAGDYNPDTTANPYASLMAYKARSLNGIWATAPYLHNGSVPTLYDLLLPKKKEDDDDPNGEYRPDSFAVGCRELDVEKVGIKCQLGVGQTYLTERYGKAIPGNSNAGHEYSAGKTAPLGADEPLPALKEEDRWALVEFMKTL
ncbi:MAG: di-heme-cytochrome C peroxidase [Thiotrichaceae bacterium]